MQKTKVLSGSANNDIKRSKTSIQLSYITHDNSGSGSGESLPFFFVLKNNSLFFQHKFIGIFPNRELFPKRL